MKRWLRPATAVALLAGAHGCVGRHVSIAQGVAHLALFSGIACLAWRLREESRSERREISAAIREFQLRRDATVEDGDGGYPCTQLLRRYRGMVEGSEVFLLQVLVGSGRRSSLWWMVATGLFPPMAQEFRLIVDRSGRPKDQPLPRLIPGATAHCQRAGWVEALIESWPESTVAAVNRLLGHDHTASVTHREVHRAIGFHDGVAEDIGAAFHEIIALARLLSRSAEETHAYSIHTGLHFVRYQEGKESFELTIDPGMTGSSVFVPTPSNWAKEVPAWAAQRREQIVARLRAHLSKEFEFVDL